MKKPISATIDEELIKWIDKEVSSRKNYRNRSHLIEVALDNFRKEQKKRIRRMAEQGTWNYEVQREGEDRVLRVNCEDYPRLPSLEDDPYTMSKTMDILLEAKAVTKIVYSQRRDYEYDFAQTQFIVELATFYSDIVRKGMLQYQNIGGAQFGGYYTEKYNQIQTLLNNTFKRDPLAAYVEMKRMLREEQINLDKTLDRILRQGMQKFVQMLAYIIRELEATRIITIASPYLAGLKVG